MALAIKSSFLLVDKVRRPPSVGLLPFIISDTWQSELMRGIMTRLAASTQRD
jgi:hypothetical protein